MIIVILYFFVCINAQSYDLDDPKKNYNYYNLDNQWTPVGRSDPLRNDPTFDYLPPVLKRVNYWIDPTLRKPDVSELLMNDASTHKVTEKFFMKTVTPQSVSNIIKPVSTKNFYTPFSKVSNIQYSPILTKYYRYPEVNSLLKLFTEKNFNKRKPLESPNELYYKVYNAAIEKDSEINNKKAVEMTTTTKRPTTFSIIEGHSKVKRYGSSTSTLNNKKSVVRKRDLEIQETEFVAKYNVSKDSTTEKYFKGIVV